MTSISNATSGMNASPMLQHSRVANNGEGSQQQTAETSDQPERKTGGPDEQENHGTREVSGPHSESHIGRIVDLNA